MKKLFSIVVLLLVGLSCHAQPWNPITPGVKRYFTNKYGVLKGVRIDSVAAYGSDLHYYPFKTLRMHAQMGAGWGGDTAGSWLGEVIIKKANGTFLFPNYWNDTITIKSLANVGDSWLFYQDSSTIYYNATVTMADTMTIMGILDSIKRITLTSFNNGTPLLGDSLNNAELILTKTFGFYKVTDLYLFPFHSPDTNLIYEDYYFKNSAAPYDLFGFNWTIGLPGPSSYMYSLAEYEPPSPATINDYNVGDIFQYSGCNFATGDWWGCMSIYYYELDTIVGKTVTNDGVLYHLSGWRATRGWTTFELHPHSDSIFFSNSNALQGMPEEFNVADGNTAPISFYLPDDTSRCHVSDLYYSYVYGAGLPGFLSYSIHKAGIGLIHQNSSSSPEVTDRRLEYSVIAGVSCGEFVLPDTSTPVVNSVTQLGGETSFKVYPNPATDHLNIECAQNNYALSLYNAVGQLVFTKAACERKQSVDVHSFTPGIYHLKLETADHEIVNNKVLIQ